MTDFLDEVDNNTNELPKQGIFFSGPFGIGKTYFLGAVANKLKEYNISTTLIYMPEFLREIRDSIRDDSINEKVNHFKQADVLMLDDIGAETQSDRKSTRLNSSHVAISYAVFCLKKEK